VSDNAFGPDGVRSYIDLLVKNRGFKYYNTNNTGLSPEGGRLIAHALSGRLIADYKKEEAEQRAASGESTTDPLPPLQLETFIAGRSRLEDGGAIALAAEFEKMGTLKEVRMPQNGIRPKGTLRAASCRVM